VGFLAVAHAEVPVAHVYDLSAASVHRPAASISDSVSAETARLILAQRLGLAQYHSLKGVDEQTIRQLNDFGGSPQRLLSKGYGDSSPGKLLVIVEGIQNPDSKQLSASKSAPRRSMECTRAQADACCIQTFFNPKTAYLRPSESQTHQLRPPTLNY